MQCEHIREKFVGFLDGDLRVTELLCVEVHLSQCYLCREELAETRDMLSCARAGMRHPDPTADVDDLLDQLALADALPNFRLGRPKIRIREWRGRLAAAAVLLIVSVFAAETTMPGHGDARHDPRVHHSASPQLQPLGDALKLRREARLSPPRLARWLGGAI